MPKARKVFALHAVHAYVFGHKSTYQSFMACHAKLIARPVINVETLNPPLLQDNAATLEADLTEPAADQQQQQQPTEGASSSSSTDQQQPESKKTSFYQHLNFGKKNGGGGFQRFE